MEHPVNQTTIGELVAQQAQKWNTKNFVHDKYSTYSFAETHQITDHIATHFQQFGLKKGEKVALFLPNRVEYVFAFLATFKAGGIVVPINPNAPKDEIEFILQNSEAKFLVCPLYGQKYFQASESLEMIFSTRGKTKLKNGIYFENLYKTPPNLGKKLPEISPNDVAGIVYTSGTNAHPKKGVQLTHENYLFASKALSEVLQMAENDRFLSTLPLHHINGQVVGILNSWQAGGEVILSDSMAPDDFLEALEKYQITIFRGTPATFAILNRQTNISNYNLRELRACICSFAPMSERIFEEFEKKFDAKILEGYGLTEGTSISTMNPIEGKRKIGSVGLPIKGHHIRIIDTETGETLPPKQKGKIVISGKNIMKSYYKKPENTATRLIDNELYTEDLGYFDDEGYLYISGRVKERIIRGNDTVYPKEIEQELLRHPSILEVAVIGLPDEIWGQEITAVIVLRPNQKLTKEEIIIYCRKKLADYRCPRQVIFQKSLPKTSTGKILKQVLTDELIEQLLN